MSALVAMLRTVLDTLPLSSLRFAQLLQQDRRERSDETEVMPQDQSDWKDLEEYFRRIATRWCRLQIDLYGESQTARERQIVEVASSPHEFALAWRKHFDVNAIDLAEDFHEDSVLFRSRKALLKDALTLSRAELALAAEYRKKGRTLPRLRTADDEDRFLEKAANLYERRSSLVIDHAAYALYVAWQPDSLVVVQDNKPALLRALAIDPESYVAITPRQFEELIAYIYETLGCRVALTQQSRDFGADILAWHPAPFGTETLIAVQVKRYAMNRRVGVKQLFELHGAVTHYHADSGHVITTSDFTGPARRFAETNRYSLIDHMKLREEILGLFKRDPTLPAMP